MGVRSMTVRRFDEIQRRLFTGRPASPPASLPPANGWRSITPATRSSGSI